MPETYLIIFRDIELQCQVEFCPPYKLAQFYSVSGNGRIPANNVKETRPVVFTLWCEVRQTGIASATFNLLPIDGQIEDLERLQKALNLAAKLMESWDANDGKTFKGIFLGEQYELSTL